MKRFWLIGIAVALMATFGVIHFTTEGHTPARQPPLSVIDSQTVSALKAAFNRSPASIRVILLLSPT